MSAVQGIRCWRVVVADSKGGGGGSGMGGSQSPYLLFFCYHCGHSFHLASVEFYSRHTNRAKILLFLFNQGIYPAAGGIYPRPREILIDMETVVHSKHQKRKKITWRNGLYKFSEPFGPFVEACTSFYEFSGTNKLADCCQQAAMSNPLPSHSRDHPLPIARCHLPPPTPATLNYRVCCVLV
jgi:hypothetical protein